MATFRNRKNKWQARVRRSGQPDVTKTFLIRTDADFFIINGNHFLSQYYCA